MKSINKQIKRNLAGLLALLQLGLATGCSNKGLDDESIETLPIIEESSDIEDGLLGEIVYNKFQNLFVREFISNDGTKYLLDANDFSKVLVSGYASISEPIYLKYYSSSYGGPDDGEGKGYVQEIEMVDGTKYLVDANDFSKVLVSGYTFISKPKYFVYYSSSYGGPDDGEGKGYVYEIEMADGTKYLVDANDFSKVLVSGYTSISKPKYFEYYSSSNGVPDDGEGKGYVYEIEMADGTKTLVDANDFKVLVSGYTSISKPKYFEYYSSSYGGPDDGEDRGCVYEIIMADGTKTLVDANDFKVLVSGYISISEPMYLKLYSSSYGGPDKGAGAGGVCEIEMADGTKYLVDANDFTIVLASGYERIDYHYNDCYLIITYHDGKQIAYTPEICPIIKTDDLVKRKIPTK